MEPILFPKIGEQDVLSRVEYFVDVQLWPLHIELDPTGWLENFAGDEKEYAVHLLNGFMYFSPLLVDEMFRAAFQSLSLTFYLPGDSFLSFQGKWRRFVESVVVTYVTGETPNPTDSGLTFARKSRQELGIEEARIMDPPDAARRLMENPGPVLFVDDFVGSGSQFVSTWKRQVSLSRDSWVSFERLAALRGTEFYYCPVLCTQYGYDNLRQECPSVQLGPAHVLSERYNALAPDSIIWPTHLRSTAAEFVKRASERAGIPDTGGNATDWRGFHNLGLALALGDSVPDATLPIFYWENNGWKPLIRRT